MIDLDLAADIVPLTTNGFPPVLTDATTPPKNITHFPAIKISGGVHSLRNLPEIILAAPSGVEFSIISFVSKAIPTPCITDPT
jgi:hypothetical protein